MNTDYDDNIQFIEDYCTFGTHRAYLLMAIARTRENPQLTSNSEVVFREVLKTEKDVRRKYDKLQCSAENYVDDEGNPLTFRLYLTVNARNTQKAYFNFQDRLNGWSQDMVRGDDAVDRKLKRIDNYWKSELQRDQSKDDSRFLFDVDTKKLDLHRLKQRLAQQTEVITTRHTPNGYHIITEPFNYTKLDWLANQDDIEVETDRMMFIKYLNEDSHNKGGRSG